jgi:hypothetical protein
VLLCAAPALAQPYIPKPTLSSTLAGDLLKAKLRWSKVVDGKRVLVEVQGGEAYRVTPGWAMQPVRLTYDLKRNRKLELAFRAAKLGAPAKRQSPRSEDRTLELLAEWKGEWLVVGTWARGVKAWRTGAPKLFAELEPLLEVQGDPFQEMKGAEK